ncbi:hypothetical protein HPG69_000967 [Diceros bicornis minor]|uniref:GH18 domain-containing protein n=1 Tax=Diceros bicornis minor TaxID=77932 RepID=A0A7J7E5B5_DICBM|nr:hypothetical protein HPG69_000967 [Diceros bicornis minor]
MKDWTDNGAPAEKLIIGFPAYGHTFILSNPSNTGIGAPTPGAGPAGPYTRQAGFWVYYEVGRLGCTIEILSAPSWKTEPLRHGMPLRLCPMPIRVTSGLAVTVRSFSIKNSFGGAMVWAINLDDFTGTFCNQNSCTTLAQPTEPVTPPPSSRSRSGRQTGSSSPGGSSGGSGFCASKAHGLCPVVNNRNAFWHCLNGIIYLRTARPGLSWIAATIVATGHKPDMCLHPHGF